MRHTTCLLLLLVTIQFLQAQEESDSSRTLGEVVVKAYEQNKKLSDVPAALVIVNQAQLNRFNNTNLLPALNSNPGIRMEERSPGSYRLNIRGSSLRSPFGIRNVKVYYDDIPFTDPGGNTYLNQLGFYNIRSIEVIKGPGSSLYGAGTGGVMLLKTTDNNWQPSLHINIGAGSYNTRNYQVSLDAGSSAFQNTVSFLKLQSDGYRDHSKLDRRVFSWDASVHVNDRAELKTHFIYGELSYETPGGLNLAQFEANPKASRPAAGPNPSAIDAKAAIYQKYFMAGMSYTQKIGAHFENTSSLYAASQRLHNPFITNYGRTSEPNGGGRTVLRYNNDIGQTKLSIQAGAEAQLGFSQVKIYGNNGGTPAELRNDDEIDNRVSFFFAQATAEFQHDIILTAGASINRQHIIITRLSDIPPSDNERTYQNEWAPRVALLKKIGKNISVYLNYAKGFSPPTTAELLPSAGIISTDLNAELGNDYELGVKGNILNNRLYFDINGFLYRVQNTIVVRRDSNGSDYFVNTGSTKQNGIETYLNYVALDEKQAFLGYLRFFLSHNYYDFTYRDYQKSTGDPSGTTIDLSGKQLPSVPKQTLTIGADLVTHPGLYLNLTFSHNDRIPLDDTNDNWAKAYELLYARLGFRKDIGKLGLDLFVSGDNLLDQTYSLGNDINAFGGRFYNAAAKRNFYAGLSFQWFFAKG